MKIIHTSDWHLGNVLYGHDRLKSEKNFLNQLKDIVLKEQPDCMIVSGDIYNLSSPSAFVQKMYTDAMLEIHQACPNMTIIVTAGNHDSPGKLEIDINLWQKFNVFVVGGIEKKKQQNVEIEPQRDKQETQADREGQQAEKEEQQEVKQEQQINLQKHIIEIKNKKDNLLGYVVAVPHFYQRNAPNLFKDLQEYIKQLNTKNLPVILSAHLAVESSEIKSDSKHVQDMEFLPLKELGNIYDYIALGHIHYPQTLKNTSDKVRYSGSPISISFNEQYPHSVSIVNIDDKHKTDIGLVKIEDNCKVRTIPDTPMKIDEVYDYVLANKDSLKNSFLQFNVLVEDYLPVNSKDNSIKLCDSIGAYFCTFKLNRKEEELSVNKKPTVTIEEFKQLTPLQVAESFFIQKGIEMKQEYKEMITQALEFNIEEF